MDATVQRDGIEGANQDQAVEACNSPAGCALVKVAGGSFVVQLAG